MAGGWGYGYEWTGLRGSLFRRSRQEALTTLSSASGGDIYDRNDEGIGPTSTE